MYAERGQESTGRGIENKFHFSKKILCKKNGEKAFSYRGSFQFPKGGRNVVLTDSSFASFMQ